ncbi:MAG: hypothetical protein GY861_10785 [bacterium]|nr:hypothetical protein [bacterium]
MGKVVYSCGHSDRGVFKGVDVAIKSFDRECNRAIEYQCVCPFCALIYEKDKMILESKKDEHEWMKGNYDE